MALSMEYGDFKPHEAVAFELDHVIAYKKSLKFNSQNVLMVVNLKNFLPQKLPAIRYFSYKGGCGICGCMYTSAVHFYWITG